MVLLVVVVELLVQTPPAPALRPIPATPSFTLVPRAGWVCPNENSFERCGHECKHRHCFDAACARIDLQWELKCSGEIGEHTAAPTTDAFLKATDLGQTSCSRYDPAISPCNTFAAELLQKVFGVTDFTTNTLVQGGSGAMSAQQMYQFVKQNPHVWQAASGVDAQAYANIGLPVVALSNVATGAASNHAAVVVPGVTTPSPVWGEVPSVVSVWLNKPEESSKPKCAPCFANYAFTVYNKKHEPYPAPEYFVRQPPPLSPKPASSAR